MEKRKMEKLGIETSLLGMGTMRLPTKEDGTIDEARAEKMIDMCIKGGINYFDTARPYHHGRSEPFIGRVLNKYPRDSYYLATKMPPWEINSPEEMKALFFRQLGLLDKDYIDFYLLHSLGKDNWKKFKEFGAIEFLEEMKKKGYIRYLGFSFHDDYDTFREILTYRDWDFCQIQYNYMDENEQAGTKGYELTEELGIPLVIMEPIRGGTLANVSDDIREIFSEAAEGKSPASFALRWVAEHPNVKVILSGMSSEEQLEDNLNTFNSYEPFSEKEKQAVISAEKIMTGRVGNKCTGCAYCMPCPNGVNIPKIFAHWNGYRKFMNKNNAVARWSRVPEDERPDNCIECGQCMAVCPQGMDIIEDLKKANEELNSLK